MTGAMVPARYQPGEFLPVLELLRANERNLIASKEAIRAKHPTWPEYVDARLTAFAKLLNVLQPTYLSLVFIHHHLASPAWWKERLNIDLSGHSDEYQFNLINYSEFAKAAYLHQSFSVVENAFRVMLRAVDLAACEGGTAEFKAVYEVLIRRALGVDREAVALLDLLRLTRNTVHNQGVFFHRRLERVDVTYQGRRFQFVQGERVTFATWPFIAQLLRELGEILTRVVASPAVSRVAPPIVERAYVGPERRG